MSVLEAVFYNGWYIDWLRSGLIALIAYLLGSINTAIVVGKAVFKQDIRQQGSGNAGSTNAIRVMGKKWGSVVALGDIAKGALAVFAGWALATYALGLNPDIGKLVGGLFAIIGHCFPVYFKFKGGKGVMTTATVLLFVDWQVTVIALAVFALVVLLTRYISLGSIVAAATLPFSSALLSRSLGFVVLMSVVALCIILFHRKNIVRLLRGQENKFTREKKS